MDCFKLSLEIIPKLLCAKENSYKENATYHKLPYIGDISVRTKKKISELCKIFCKKSDINIVLTAFKTSSLFLSKDRLPSALRSFVFYKFTCAGCQFCYIGETRGHLATRINEHLVTDKKSHIRAYVTKVAFKSLIMLLLLLG